MNIQDSKSLVVIITGGTRGIGRGLAKCFLERGASVVISGRIGEVVRRAVEELKAEVAGPGSALKSAEAVPVAGTECDVREFAQVQALWDYAISSFGRVDIWINNAGIGQPQSDIDELKPDLIRDIFGTNCTGALYGCKVAMTGMRAQGDGAIYNLEGLGSNGSIVRGMAAYGASKRALAYITDSMAKEAEGSGVIVGALRPGMVVTDLIIGEYAGKPEEWKKVRRIFNILSDRVETVAPWLVDQMLQNRRNGRRIVWLTGLKTMGRFLSAPFVKRSVYPEME
ncbi:NYC1 chlorophyll b reductase [uncultured spirochete]|jgi:NAD(P)-dependent dehydrogenase (short-subunit alcohol dehydrogenase family)|uniref:NYC1 chlorophyll b reductase n=1 Tax=uncultured spirochete TaxID=156406 RepID=A0A3P3XIJ7_9SPIR|nr:SDR family oxidoreductase [Rectinema subterraneum]SLM12845.1 NYC1 chlorophyll b reductase [uncultured spirochete]